jgi:hypothetical protein
MNTFKNKAAACAAKVKSSADERSYVRELAALCVEIAREARMRPIIQRWRDVNSGRLPDRAPVWCRPAGCWAEMLPQDSLVCKDPFLREMEYYFRQQLLRRDIDDDHPVYEYFKVNAVIDENPDPPYGFAPQRHSLDDAGSAWGYESALETEDDFKRLTVPQYKFNKEKSAGIFEKHAALLDGIMETRLTAINGFFSIATICTQAADLRGMEQMMMDMMLQPELIHHLMQVISQGVMNYLDAIEASGLIFPNIDEPMFLSDPLRPPPADGKYTLKDCWCAGNSQEFDPVSPDMMQEFLVDYQNRIFERFGATCYGCCENLTNKIDQVLTVPNLRVFVSSAWSDLAKIVERTDPDKHCIMWRHSASDVTCLDTLDKVRKDTEDGAKILEGRRYQIVLRELQSLFGRENRIYEWAQMCKEITARHA